MVFMPQIFFSWLTPTQLGNQEWQTPSIGDVIFATFGIFYEPWLMMTSRWHFRWLTLRFTSWCLCVVLWSLNWPVVASLLLLFSAQSEPWRVGWTNKVAEPYSRFLTCKLQSLVNVVFTSRFVFSWQWEKIIGHAKIEIYCPNLSDS